LYAITVFLVLVVTFFCGMLLTINTQNSIEKVTEDVAQQATTTSSSTAYITMTEHLKEMNAKGRL
jgi:succinate dehydrogenase hydrophobic anchor subunit